MSSYATIADVYRWIPKGSVQNPARLITNLNTTTEILSLDGHGMTLDDELTFRAESGGTMPTGIVEGTTYYAIPLTDSTFSIAATTGGSAIDLSGTGTNVAVIVQLPWASWITAASARIDCTIPAHAAPLAVPYPAIVVDYTAGLVAEMALAFSGATSTGLNERMVNVRAELKEWRRGIPIRGTDAPSSGNVAITGTVSSVDPRGYFRDADPTRIP